MSVIINNRTYTSGVSNVVDNFAELSPTSNCDGYNLSEYESNYIQVDQFEVTAPYVYSFGFNTAVIDFDIDLLISQGYKVEITDTYKEMDETLYPVNPYVAISKDKQFWTENTIFDFNSNAVLGNVYIEDGFEGEPIFPSTLNAIIKIYRLSKYRIEYTNCSDVKNVIEVENEIVGQTISYVDSPHGNSVSPVLSYSDINSPILINPVTSPGCTDSKLVQYIPSEYTEYLSGYEFYYNWENLGSIAFIDVKIEGVDGYCEFELYDENGGLIGTYSSANPPQNGIERFEIGTGFSQYLKLVVTKTGAYCDPLHSDPGKLIMDLIVQSPQNTDGVLLECCPCGQIDFCGNDFVEIEFTNNCEEVVKLVFKGKLQGGVYKFAGEEFTTYSGQRIRPTTNIEAQYTLVIFEYSDAFFLALQDIIANNLTMKIAGYEYYFFTSDITPTWDNFSEYGFASITLTRKDTIKKYRRNCCS
jgi:hypothetical protein